MHRFSLAATAAFSALLIAGAASAQTTDPSAQPPPPADAAAPAAAPAPDTTTAPPPAPAKALPTAGIAMNVLSALDRACAPLVRGTTAKAAAADAGMRINGDGELTVGLDGGRRITIQPPSVANPTNCTMTVRYASGEDAAILDGLQAWSQRRDPPLNPDKVAASSPEDGGVSVISTWIGAGQAKVEGLVYILHNKTDGTPQGGRIGEAQVLYSYRPY